MISVLFHIFNKRILKLSKCSRRAQGRLILVAAFGLVIATTGSPFESTCTVLADKLELPSVLGGVLHQSTMLFEPSFANVANIAVVGHGMPLIVPPVLIVRFEDCMAARVETLDGTLLHVCEQMRLQSRLERKPLLTLVTGVRKTLMFSPMFLESRLGRVMLATSPRWAIVPEKQRTK